MPLLTTGVYVATGSRGSRRGAWPPRAAVPAAAVPPGAVPGARFSPAERERLLLERGIGPTTVERLERAGFASLEALRRAGVPQVVEAVVEVVDTPGWRNRLRALQRVVHTAGGR